MSFFTRPSLENRQFRQLSGDTLTLSGETNFVGILKSKNVEIDASYATALSATTGHVLTLLPTGKVVLAPNAAVQAPFDSSRITTRVGIPAVNVGGSNVNDFLEGYFFPSVPPTATLVATNNSRQFGNILAGVLNWNVVRNTNPLLTIRLDTNGDGTLNTLNLENGSGNTQGGSVAYSFAGTDSNPVTGTTSKVRTYKIDFQTATEDPSDVTATVQWRHKRFWFNSGVLYNSANTIALQSLINAGVGINGEFSTSKAKTFGVINLSNEYFYFVHPKTFGQPSYTVNGLPNNAWGSIPTTLFEFSYTNTDGYTETFYVGRSDSKITGSFTILTA